MDAGKIDGIAIDEQIDLMASIESGRKRGAMFQADLNGIGDGSGIFLAAEREVFVGGAAAEKQRPIRGEENLLQIIGGFSGGVKAADEAAHAGAGKVVDGDMVLFKPFQNADVGF